MREALWSYRRGREPFREASGERLPGWDGDRLRIRVDFRLYACIGLGRGQLHRCALWRCLKACPGKAESNGGFGFDCWSPRGSETPACGRNAAG